MVRLNSCNTQQIAPRTMAPQPDHSIIAELEDAVRTGSPAERVETLRQVTNLFLHDGARLSEEQVKIFDDVMCLLIARVESRARAEFGKRMAPIAFAPPEVVQHLAWDDEIAVAGDVLAHSGRLKTGTLVEIARKKGQEHLLAISGRTDLPEAVTDVIVDRGGRKVIRKLANNASARFSEAGYSGIVARAVNDDELTEILGLRIDLPIKFLRDLLRRASDAVRARLAAIASPELREEIKRLLTSILGEAVDASPTRDFSVVEKFIRLKQELNELDDATVFLFAEAGKFDEVIVSLAVLNDAPIELMARLLGGLRADLILIPCRSARLNWPSVETILRNRPMPVPINEESLAVAQRDYRKLSMQTARRTVRFWQLHNRIEK
jgi:uncharacterized protein (DUF2336 family)